MTSTAPRPSTRRPEEPDQVNPGSRSPTSDARDDAPRAHRHRGVGRLRLRQHPGHAGRTRRAGHPAGRRPAMVRQVVHRLADTGVRVLDVELARIGPDDEPDEFLEVLEAAAAVGARHVIGQLPSRPRPGPPTTSAASASSPSTTASRSTSSSPRGAPPGTSPRPPPSSGRSTRPTPGSSSARSTSSAPTRRSTS